MKRKRILFAGLLFLTILFNSCIINRTRKPVISNICALHNIKMHKAVVGIHYGLYAYHTNEDIAPNAKEPVRGGCVVRPKKLAIIYHCKKCDRIAKGMNSN